MKSTKLASRRSWMSAGAIALALLGASCSDAAIRTSAQGNLEMAIVEIGSAEVGKQVHFLLEITNHAPAPVRFTFAPYDEWTGYGYEQGLVGSYWGMFGSSEPYCPDLSAVFVLDPGEHLLRFAEVGPFEEVLPGDASVSLHTELVVWGETLDCADAPNRELWATADVVFDPAE